VTPEDFDRIRRFGAFAETLLVDETFRDIMRGIKDDIIRSWGNCNDPDNREALWRDLQAVGRFGQKLKDLGQAYRAEATRLEAEKKQQERVAKRVEAAERG
jgi:hypothetical protein